MHKLYFLCLLTVTTIFIGYDIASATNGGIVISQVQLGDSVSASNEYVELYNNSSLDVEISNWCLYYASASSLAIGNKMTCFLVDDPTKQLFLPSNAYLLAASSQLLNSTPGFGSDYIFSAILSGSAGHVRLIDANGGEIDKLGWGSAAVSAEGSLPTTAPVNGKVLGRNLIEPNLLKDTNVNRDDFEAIYPRPSYFYGYIYEVRDLCGNIDGTQTEMPDGYVTDNSNNCVDSRVDLCPNLGGLQEIIPMGYKSESNQCLLDLPYIRINELVPNALGIDDGNEYIELYNPNEQSIDLANYRIATKPNGSEFAFPEKSNLSSNEYRTFSNDDIKFTLVNTIGAVLLTSNDGQVIDQTLAYDNPAEGESWSWFSDGWSYTTQPTPNQPNISVLPLSDLDEEVQKPCASNQYRSEETGRCRLITSASSQLVPCRVGQYRSEETNRCRSISSDVNIYAACSEGEVRNPETNRCKSTVVLGASALNPCKIGQERNPETNRCRNVSTLKKPGYSPKLDSESRGSNITMISMSILGFVALGYAVWEWRIEVTVIMRKLFSFRKS